jgi:hypothetical protein
VFFACGALWAIDVTVGSPLTALSVIVILKSLFTHALFSRRLRSVGAGRAKHVTTAGECMSFLQPDISCVSPVMFVLPP